MTENYYEFAWLYDAAFSWDVTDEVRWLIERLAGPASVLEPACGSGRMLEGFARAGVAANGLDRSPVMLRRARERFARGGLPEPHLAVGELTSCDIAFAGPFDAAVMPIGTFGYLATNDDASAHLAGMARLLRPGARYLVQFDLETLATFQPRLPGPTSCWDTPHERGTIRCTVSGRDWNPATCMTTEIARFEILDGPEAGFCHESEHPMRVWDWAAWSALVAASPFEQTAAYDGNDRARSELERGPALEGRPLLWHELTLPA